jgi:hypothetical protein
MIRALSLNQNKNSLLPHIMPEEAVYVSFKF